MKKVVLTLSLKPLRYSHLLDATTGWPVIDSVRSVTVAAPSIIEAGMLATLALLQGKKPIFFTATKKALLAATIIE